MNKPCKFCDTGIATNKNGVCEDCKIKRPVSTRMCVMCGQPGDGRSGRIYCAECRPAPRVAAPRLCYRGCGREAINSNGKPLCAPCRLDRICTGCGLRKDGLTYGRCDDCKVRRSATRIKILKECKDCGRDIRSKSNSNYCGPCAHERQKHPCPGCGKQIDRRSKQCSQCWGAAHKRENCPTWKGGRTIMLSHGYVLVQSPGHPKSSNGYMREHVLVMEEMLGRYLLPGENVHHLNGVREDNRPENLELWLVHQPAGQRVEDLADWAIQVLTRYRPHLLRSPLLAPSPVAGSMSQLGPP